MVKEKRLQVSTTSHTRIIRSQRQPVALGYGMGALPLSLFSRLAEAKPEDTCAYPAGRGWQANTHTA